MLCTCRHCLSSVVSFATLAAQIILTVMSSLKKNFMTLHLEIQAHNWPKCQTSTTWNILKLWKTLNVPAVPIRASISATDFTYTYAVAAKTKTSRKQLM